MSKKHTHKLFLKDTHISKSTFDKWIGRREGGRADMGPGMVDETANKIKTRALQG